MLNQKIFARIRSVVLVALSMIAAGPTLAQTPLVRSAGLPALVAPAERPPTQLVPPGDAPRTYLLAARSAVERSRSGIALESLERAETRLLDQSAPAPQAMLPNVERTVLDIAVARRFVAARDRVGALRAIDDALARVTAPGDQLIAAPALPQLATPPLPLLEPSVSAPVAVPVLVPEPAPVSTFRLLPGRWELHGATYDWVPPETVLRRVETRRVVEGRYGWVDDMWTWIPRHFTAQ